MTKGTKFLLDFSPLFVFFAVNYKWGIYYATASLMVLSIISLVVSYIIEKKIPKTPLITMVFILIFGSLTLYLQDETFIKIKPTLINLLFAGILLFGIFKQKYYMSYMFGDSLKMSQASWRVFSIRWVFFFVFLAGINEFVWRMYSTDTWVAFKTFGLLPIMLVFMILQFVLLRKEISIDNDASNNKKK